MSAIPTPMKSRSRRLRQSVSGPFRFSMMAALLGMAPASQSQTAGAATPAADQPTPAGVPATPESTNKVAAPTPPAEPKPVGPVVYFEPFPTNTVATATSLNPGVTYLDSQIPQAPWLSSETPTPPEWAPETQPRSPFTRAGLGTSALGGSQIPATSNRRPGAGGASTPLRLGPVDIQPRLGYQLLYGSGLPSLGRNSDATVLHSISPGVSISAGRFWNVQYNPSIRIYDTEGYDNTVNHTVSLEGGAVMENWKFGLRHATAISSDPLIETGEQTDQTTHSTSVSGTWNRNTRGTYSFSVDQRLRDTTKANDVNSWSTEHSYDVAVRPKLRVGLGAGVGYDMVDPGSDMMDEHVSLRLSGPLGQRISYNFSGGVSFREFLDTDASTAITPRIGLNVAYQVLEKTSVSLGANHGTSTSYFSDQFTENTTVQGGITQRLTERWSLSASGGVRFTSYQSTIQSDTVQREDTSTFANVSAGTLLFTKVSLSIFYSFQSNDSDSQNYGFESHQVGMSLQWSL